MTAPSQLDPQLSRWLDEALAMGEIMAGIQGRAPERVLAGDPVISDYLRALGKSALMVYQGCPAGSALKIEHVSRDCKECPFARLFCGRSGPGETLPLPEARDFAGVERNLVRLARLFADPDAGLVARQRFREAMAGLKADQGLQGASVLCLVSHGRNRFSLAGRDTICDCALDAMGLYNWARGLSGYLPLRYFEGLHCQPDSVLVLDASPGEYVSPESSWLKGLRAWQQGRVLCLRQSDLMLWGPGMAERLRWVRQHLQPTG